MHPKTIANERRPNVTAASKKTVWIMLACALAGAWATTSGKREGTGAGCPALLSVNALAAEAAGA